MRSAGLQVGGALTNHIVEHLSVGVQHVAALVSTNFPRTSTSSPNNTVSTFATLTACTLAPVHSSLQLGCH